MILRLIILLLLCSPILGETIVRASRIVPSATVELRDPRSLSVGADGMLFIADTGHHRILALDSTGQLVMETGGFGSEHGQFQWPRKIIADRGAAVWVLDYGNRRIEKFSRAMEYQGTLLIPSEDESPPRQIEELALSPQGDLYVFDLDGGRVLLYDPLFRVQAELGQSRGGEFISALTRMTFVSGIGLVWWERGAETVRIADPLLTEIRTLNLKASSPSSMVLTSADSCLVFGTRDFLNSWCDPAVSPDTFAMLSAHPDLSLKRLDDIAFANRSTMYALDGVAGAIYLVSLSER